MWALHLLWISAHIPLPLPLPFPSLPLSPSLPPSLPSPLPQLPRSCSHSVNISGRTCFWSLALVVSQSHTTTATFSGPGSDRRSHGSRRRLQNREQVASENHRVENPGTRNQGSSKLARQWTSGAEDLRLTGSTAEGWLREFSVHPPCVARAFLPQIFTERLLCAKCCSRPPGDES